LRLVFWFLFAAIAAVFLFNFVFMNTKTAPKEIPTNASIATLAGGCFWCVEADYEKLNGVYEAVSGYAGGSEENPSYEEVSSSSTGHREAVQVYFDAGKVSYEEILDYFWQHINPTDSGGQFVDRGKQYTSAIFYHDEEQRKIAEASKQKLAASGKFDQPIVTEILPFTTFYPAEDYHQDYHQKNPLRYKFYRHGSGRDKFLDETWPNKKEDLKSKLTPLQYEVTQKDGTEPAFDNEYWDEERDGIYVDIISGEPLFSSLDKYKSGTGWPSFTRPLVAENIVEKEDRGLLTTRTEIRSKIADSHLGHVFDDGPKEAGGLRYCMNSAALRFIPKEDLEAEGYSEWMKLFE